MRPILLALPLLCAACTLRPPPVLPGSLLLSNPDFGPTEVEAVATTRPVCTERGPGVLRPQFFVIPNNGTRFIEAPIGADLCWRWMVMGADQSLHWSNWNMTYTYPGRSIDTKL